MALVSKSSFRLSQKCPTARRSVPIPMAPRYLSRHGSPVDFNIQIKFDHPVFLQEMIVKNIRVEHTDSFIGFALGAHSETGGK